MSDKMLEKNADMVEQNEMGDENLTDVAGGSVSFLGKEGGYTHSCLDCQFPFKNVSEGMNNCPRCGGMLRPLKPYIPNTNF